jgi:Tfp pilus assembly pilus retraction ATPase PilT
MQVGQMKYGMSTFNQSLASLAMKKQISRELALSMSSNAEELREMLERGAAGMQPVAAGSGGRGRSRR